MLCTILVYCGDIIHFRKIQQTELTNINDEFECCKSLILFMIHLVLLRNGMIRTKRNNAHWTEESSHKKYAHKIKSGICQYQIMCSSFYNSRPPQSMCVVNSAWQNNNRLACDNIFLFQILYR